MVTSVILASELRISVRCHNSDFVNKLWREGKKRGCDAVILDTAVYLIMDVRMKLGVVYTDELLAQLGMRKSYQRCVG